MTHYICATEAEARRLIRAIDAVRVPDGTERVDIIEGGRIVRSETRPARPWAEPIPLRDGTYAVPMPDRKAAAVLRDLPPTREVDVGNGTTVRVRVPTLQERVTVRDEDRADVEPEREPGPTVRETGGATRD